MLHSRFRAQSCLMVLVLHRLAFGQLDVKFVNSEIDSFSRIIKIDSSGQRQYDLENESAPSVVVGDYDFYFSDTEQYLTQWNDLGPDGLYSELDEKPTSEVSDDDAWRIAEELANRLQIPEGVKRISLRKSAGGGLVGKSDCPTISVELREKPYGYDAQDSNGIWIRLRRRDGKPLSIVITRYRIYDPPTGRMPEADIRALAASKVGGDADDFTVSYQYLVPHRDPEQTDQQDVPYHLRLMAVALNRKIRQGITVDAETGKPEPGFVSQSTGSSRRTTPAISTQSPPFVSAKASGANSTPSIIWAIVGIAAAGGVGLFLRKRIR